MRVPIPSNGERTNFSTESAGKNWIATCKTMTYTYLIPYAEIDSKWITDLNLRAKAINS